MTTDVGDPLLKLKVNTDELDRQKLAELLNGYCVISENGQIRPVTNYSLLDSKSKVLLVILAQKAAKALGLSETDRIQPSSIESISGLPGGTVRVKLMELRQQRLVDSEKGSYTISNHSIFHVSLKMAQQTQVKSALKKLKTRHVESSQEKTETLKKLLDIDQAKIDEKRLDLLLSPGRYLEKSLVILAIGSEIGIDSLSPRDITTFLKEKIRINIKRENISFALGKATRYVARFENEVGGGYCYKIMTAGDVLLKGIFEENT